jgi:SNF2 family DNA or RNA helicase
MNRAKDAGKDVRDLSERRRKDLDNIMLRVHLKRRKEDVLKNTLKEKNQFVVFCPLTPIQKTLYQNILNLPDYQILKKSELPCNCGVNQSFFLAMKKLSSK